MTDMFANKRSFFKTNHPPVTIVPIPKPPPIIVIVKRLLGY